MANLTSFTAGDLVVSVSGDGDGSGAYTDNQGSPITLVEYSVVGTASATMAGQFVLPQTTTTVNGVTQYAISGEYGSSSEGSLALSADGQSLVIAGYGINAATYNAGEAGITGSKATGGTYGNNALAQTYSVPNGGTNGAPAGVTVVSRVIADISYNGTVDTSTSLINVDNTNNPRSVATVNGSSFYLSGQGVKGDTTQGVFVATDGANNTTPTAISTATDTRTAELYNGTLYVSADSSSNKGTGNISSYGTSPTGATTATPLPGITGKVTIAGGNGNSLNSTAGTVDISPENFFFANSTTLYVADSGNPKGGTIGDGGLQKWSLSNGTWVLDYTLSNGLNLVSAATTTDPGPGANATTGLIGLAGKVNTDGTVSLYATNATVGDLNQTYIYGITDTLAATAAATSTTESFTQLAAAASDTNIRGIAFAPQAATACYCTGTMIRTSRGDIAVEALNVGDLVVTSSGERRPIRWIGRQTIDCRDEIDAEATLPVRVQRHAFGANRPSSDLWLSPGHAVCLDLIGEILVPVGELVNGATIVQEPVETVTYWHVELSSHDILIANNMPAESYIDIGNRAFFTDGKGLPDGKPTSLADYCRPLVQDETTIGVLRARLVLLAGTLGWTFAPAEPDLHLEVDGAIVRPEIDGDLARFILPAGASDVWLVSPTFVPKRVGLNNDTRTLGLRVQAIRFDNGLRFRREADGFDPLLRVGFHPPEPGSGLVWTSGRARLPAELWSGCKGSFFLQVMFDAGGRSVWRHEAVASREPMPRQGLRLVGEV